MNTLRDLIRIKGIRQRDLAERLNVTEPTISRWANRQGAIPASAIMTLAEMLDVAPEAVLAVATPQQATQDAA